MNLKLISWNINGIVPSNLDKVETLNSLGQLNPDIICLQEVKCHGVDDSFNKINKMNENIANAMTFYCNSITGYSGTLSLLSKKSVLSNKINFSGILDLICNEEYRKYNVGRIVYLDFSLDNLTIFNVYIPNSGTGLVRMNYKSEWMSKFTELILRFINKGRRVIILGDVNVVPTKNDIKNWVGNHDKSPGCTTIETGLYYDFLNKTKLIDVADNLGRNSEYTFFGRFTERNKLYNAGWRLDHIWISPSIKIVDYKVHKEFKGSDHVPIEVSLEV